MTSVAASVNRLAHPSSHTGRGIAAGAGAAAPPLRPVSVDGSTGIHRPAFERKARLGRDAFEHHARRTLANGGTVLETMARPATNDPYVVVFRMPIDQKVARR